MRLDVQIDAEFSQRASRSAWPLIGPMIGEGEFLSIEEARTRGLRTMLDIRAGIDAYQLKPNGDMVGLALRMQRAENEKLQGRCPCTHTIRLSRPTGAETEFAKRRRAIESDFGASSAEVNIQGYVKNDGAGPCIGVAAVRQDDLTRYAIEFFETLKRIRAGNGGQEALVVHWDKLHAWGARIRIWMPPLSADEAEQIMCDVYGIGELSQPSDKWAQDTIYSDGWRLVPSGGSWILMSAPGKNVGRVRATIAKWIQCQSDAAREWVKAQKNHPEWTALEQRSADVQARLGESIVLPPHQRAKEWPEAAE